MVSIMPCLCRRMDERASKSQVQPNPSLGKANIFSRIRLEISAVLIKCVRLKIKNIQSISLSLSARSNNHPNIPKHDGFRADTF